MPGYVQNVQIDAVSNLIEGVSTDNYYRQSVGVVRGSKHTRNDGGEYDISCKYRIRKVNMNTVRRNVSSEYYEMVGYIL